MRPAKTRCAALDAFWEYLCNRHLSYFIHRRLKVLDQRVNKFLSNECAIETARDDLPVTLDTFRRKYSKMYSLLAPFATCLCRYSGFNFSHYDLPFPTRYCIPYMRSGLYQLVIRVKGFRVSAHDLDSHCIRFCPSAWTPRFERVELCIASARTTLAVSAVAPS